MTVAAIGTSIEAGSGGVSWLVSALARGTADGVNLALATAQSIRAVGGSVWSGGSFLPDIQTQLGAAIADRPDVLFCGGMVNDKSSWTGATVSNAAFMAEMQKCKTVADQCIAAGIFPVFFGDMATAGGNQAHHIARWNRVLSRWSEINGYYFIDPRGTIARVQDGASPSGTFTADGVHPNPAGANRYANEFIRQMNGTEFVSEWTMQHDDDYSNAADVIGANLCLNGIPVGETGLADTAGWSGTPTVVIATEYSGAMVTLPRAAAGGTLSTYTDVGLNTPNVLVGDRVRIAWRKMASVAGTGSAYRVRIHRMWTSSFDMLDSDIDFADSPVHVDYIRETSVGGLRFELANDPGTVVAATGNVGAGNLAMVNIGLIDRELRAAGLA
jgi:hypothetical protein